MIEMFTSPPALQIENENVIVVALVKDCSVGRMELLVCLMIVFVSSAQRFPTHRYRKVEMPKVRQKESIEQFRLAVLNKRLSGGEFLQVQINYDVVGCSIKSTFFPFLLGQSPNCPATAHSQRKSEECKRRNANAERSPSTQPHSDFHRYTQFANPAFAAHPTASQSQKVHRMRQVRVQIPPELIPAPLESQKRIHQHRACRFRCNEAKMVVQEILEGRKEGRRRKGETGKGRKEEQRSLKALRQKEQKAKDKKR